MFVVYFGIVITVLTMIPVVLQLRQHPKGLVILFFAEMWERFSYYGMRGLLILYFTQKFLFDQGEAADHYGAYVALMYLTPLVGGVLADRWLGTRKAITFGAVLLVIGQLGLAFEGPGARQVVSYQGHDYSVTTTGRMADASSKIMVGGQGYSFGPSSDGGLKIDNLPAGAAVPAVMPKGSFTLSVKDRNPLFLQLFYLALAINIMGVGYLKANISSIVGQLYPQGDPRRDPGFTLYYYGINLGSFWAGVVPGLVGATVGWWAGFGLGAIGMLAGLIVFVIGKPLLQGTGEPPNPAALKKPVLGPVNLEWTLYLAAIVGVVIAFVLMVQTGQSFHLGAVDFDLMDVLMALLSIGVVGYLFWFMATRCDRVARQRLGLALVLILGSMVFWTLFEQAGSSLNLFANTNVNLSMGPVSMTTAQAQAINPGFILILAPVFAGLWTWLGRARLDPNPVWKFGLALIQVGAGFLVLVYGANFMDAQFRVPLIFLMLAYLLHTTGELCLSPVGLSEVTKLAPPILLSTMVAVWFLAISVANKIGGKIAKLTASETVGGKVLDPHASLLTSNYWFNLIGWIAVGVGVIYLLLGPFLKKWSNGANDAANHPVIATDQGQP
jgi:POT family proton-dependent oligopeptide transporter